MCAGTRERVKADFYKTRINQEWERKPYDVLSELSNVCAASIPSEKKIIQQAKREWKTPVAQCSLEIHPAAHNEEGTLQVEVCHKNCISQQEWSSNWLGNVMSFQGYKQAVLNL